MTTTDPWTVAAADGQTIIHHLKSEGWAQQSIADAIGATKSAISKAATGHDKNGCSAENTRRLQKLWCRTHALPEPDVDPIPVPAWLRHGMWREAEDLRQRRFTEFPEQWRNTTNISSCRPPVDPVAEMTGLPLARIETIMGAPNRRRGSVTMITPQEIDLICCRLGILNLDLYGLPA
jgi:hypothetical protein